jgi:hypothetical protein
LTRFGHAARSVKPILLTIVGERWNGDDLSLVETGEGVCIRARSLAR